MVGNFVSNLDGWILYRGYYKPELFLLLGNSFFVDFYSKKYPGIIPGSRDLSFSIPKSRDALESGKLEALWTIKAK